MSRPTDVGVGLCVLIFNKKGEVLLMKRKGAHRAEHWAGPGGWIDRGDATLTKAASREVGEELNLTLVGKPRFVVATTEDQPELNCRTVTLYYSSNSFLGTPMIMEPEKCSEFGWFPPHKLPSPLFPGLAFAVSVACGSGRFW